MFVAISSVIIRNRYLQCFNYVARVVEIGVHVITDSGVSVL